MGEYSCTELETQEIYKIFGSNKTVESICGGVNVTELGVGSAIMKYTLTKIQDTTHPHVDIMFLLFCGYIVFLMQAGFAMLCAGQVRSKNTMNILLKNVIDACAGALCYYLIGFGLAYGKDADGYSNPFIGNWDFALVQTARASREASTWQTFFFQWAFAAATATIVSGAVAERCSFAAYLGYTSFMTAFVYPVVSHWVWDYDGWLSAFNTKEKLLGVGAIDFAGSGVVHMTGGVAAIVGAAIIGPRIGRFNDGGKPNPMRGHSGTLVVLGTFMLWFGWYGFNPGSALSIVSYGTVVARTAVTTTIGAAAGGLTALVMSYWLTKLWDPLEVCNGVLAGLVGITAGCSVVEPWAAIIIGALGAMAYYGGCKLLVKMQIDDVVAAGPVHGFAGALGVLMVGFLATPYFMNSVYGYDESEGLYGVFYGGNGKVLACQVIEIVVVTAWTAVLMGGFFLICKMLNVHRVPVEVEMQGLDESKHGGNAYTHEVDPKGGYGHHLTAHSHA